MIGLVPWFSGRCFHHWSVFVWLRVGDRLFSNFRLLDVFMLMFIRIVSVDGFQIALVEVLGGFWTGFDTWFGVFVESVEIKVCISYFPLKQR